MKPLELKAIFDKHGIYLSDIDFNYYTPGLREIYEAGRQSVHDENKRADEIIANSYRSEPLPISQAEPSNTIINGFIDADFDNWFYGNYDWVRDNLYSKKGSGTGSALHTLNQLKVIYNSQNAHRKPDIENDGC